MSPLQQLLGVISKHRVFLQTGRIAAERSEHSGDPLSLSLGSAWLTRERPNLFEEKSAAAWCLEVLVSQSENLGAPWLVPPEVLEWVASHWFLFCKQPGLREYKKDNWPGTQTSETSWDFCIFLGCLGKRSTPPKSSVSSQLLRFTEHSEEIWAVKHFSRMKPLWPSGSDPLRWHTTFGLWGIYASELSDMFRPRKHLFLCNLYVVGWQLVAWFLLLGSRNNYTANFCRFCVSHSMCGVEGRSKPLPWCQPFFGSLPSSPRKLRAREVKDPLKTHAQESANTHTHTYTHKTSQTKNRHHHRKPQPLNTKPTKTNQTIKKTTTTI